MKTASGFEFEVRKDALDNMELLDLFGEMQSNAEDFTVLGRLVDLLLGRDARKALYDHIRTPDGRVPVGAFASEVTEIFRLMQESLKK